MSELYKSIEKEIQELDSITDWNVRINKMKEIKKRISMEQNKLVELSNSISNDDLNNNHNKKNKTSLNELITTFKESSNLEDKVKLYATIIQQIKSIEKEYISNNS